MESFNYNQSKSAKNGVIRIEEILHNVFIEELNIYNHAYLILDCPLMKTTKIHPQTKYEKGIRFNLKGELQGQVTCLIDHYNKNPESFQHLNSLFTESMNILLGKAVTNLENDYEISSLISAPIQQETFSFIEKSFENNTYSTSYKLISNTEEYDIRLIVTVLRKNIIEV